MDHYRCELCEQLDGSVRHADPAPLMADAHSSDHIEKIAAIYLRFPSLLSTYVIKLAILPDIPHPAVIEWMQRALAERTELEAMEDLWYTARRINASGDDHLIGAVLEAISLQAVRRRVAIAAPEHGLNLDDPPVLNHTFDIVARDRHRPGAIEAYECKTSKSGLSKEVVAAVARANGATAGGQSVAASFVTLEEPTICQLKVNRLCSSGRRPHCLGPHDLAGGVL
jgi:hypothetical protein